MRLLGTLLIAVALLAPLPSAALTDSFPNQPGALTDEELKAAASAAGTELPLVASGKRSAGHPMPAYALFAGESADFVGRAKVRPVVICNLTVGQWRCDASQKKFQMSANGMEHLFYYRTEQGAGDPQAALGVVDFMFSKCFWDSFAAIGGKPFTPSQQDHYVNTVLDQGHALQVVLGPLGNGDSYTLEKTGDGCAFRIWRARIAKTDTWLPESYARQLAQHAAEQREQLEAKHKREKRLAQLSGFAIPTMYAAMVSGTLALIVPLFLLRISRHLAAVTAGVLAAACTTFGVFSIVTMPGGYIRIDIFINGFLILASWSLFAGLLLWAMVGGREAR